MTGNELYKRVLGLLGYLNTDTLSGTENLFKRALDIINQMCLDLKITQIDMLSDEIKADNKKIDALCYGTAMLMALVEGDGAKNEIFAKIYNAKRALALSNVDKVEDKLPFIS